MEDKAPSVVVLLVFLICSYLFTALSILLGLAIRFSYWLLFDSFGRETARAQRKLRSQTDLQENEYYTLIIGTGFSGLGMAIKLNQLGMDNYILVERQGHIGGTWYANKYPGCACDVPSNLYSFSFEPNPQWSYYFSRQPEIAAYLEHLADKYDIRRHIQFNTNVIEMRWLQDRQLWQVTVQSNDEIKEFFARFVIAASGPLSNESYPSDIPGIDRFEGGKCHTARWDSTIDFTNKRVAVIGTGASAIQVAPEIQKMNISQLIIFQRTAPWTIPRLDRRVSNFEKYLFKKFPILQKLIREFIYWGREVYVLAFAYRWPTRFINQALVKQNLRMQIKDEELRKKLTPVWDLGCKRVLVTSDWYPTLQKPNVQLITNRIREIRSHSIVTHDGDEYPVDVIIWSTGFQTQRFGIPIYGIDGCSLAEQWSETMQAYRGVTVPNFPNLFILLGPNSRLGHSSVIIMLEAQLKYIVESLLYMDEKNIRMISLKQSAHDQYNQQIQNKLKKTVWHLGGCHSWYQDAKGNVTTIWPDFTWMYTLLMNHFDHENYYQQ